MNKNYDSIIVRLIDESVGHLLYEYNHKELYFDSFATKIIEVCKYFTSSNSMKSYD